MAESKHISIGRLGEDIACGYLKNRGFLIKDRNYRKKWGELDIVAHKDGVLHIVEVKAGSWTGPWPKEGVDMHRPEDHMHKNKLARLGRALQTYITDHPLSEGEQWTVDLAVVYINEETHRARVNMLWNILLE
jgi:Holliday junction resolvase-like predicted endonuclease